MKALLITVAVLLGSAASALAQTQVTPADIQRLQDGVYDASADMSRLRDRDARLAESLQRELDDLRDEVIYLKVKLRKESKVSRAEYARSSRSDRSASAAEARGEPARAVVLHARR